MKPTTCPACNSVKIKVDEYNRRINAPFGPEIEIKEKAIHCFECNENYPEHSAKNDYLIAYKNSAKGSVRSILDYLYSQKFSFSDIERALDLPYRTLSRWKKTKEVSAPALVLLRFIRAMPWLIEVADNNYESDVINNKIFQNAYKLFKENMERYVGPASRPLINKKQNEAELIQHFGDYVVSFGVLKKGKESNNKNIQYTS
jgi:hypothetical protein